MLTANFGTGFEIIKPATALGGAAGINIPLITPQQNLWCNQIAGWLQYVASATAGSRRLSAQIKDASGNVMMQTANSFTLQAASTTWFYALSPGAPGSDLSAALGIMLAWPMRIVIQPGSSLQIFDIANVSTADTIAANLTLALT
jgi:hypothetical protein